MVRIFYHFRTVPFFTAIATVTVPFFSLTVRSEKRTKPKVLTVRFLVFDRESYCTKISTVICLWVRTANRTAPNGVRHPFIFKDREPRCDPYRTKIGAVRLTVPNNKLTTVPLLERCGLRFPVITVQWITVPFFLQYGSNKKANDQN